MKISLSIWVNVGSPLLVLPVLQTRSVFFLDCRDGWWLKNIKRHPWVFFFFRRSLRDSWVVIAI
jgi:hypothetical protein